MGWTQDERETKASDVRKAAQEGMEESVRHSREGHRVISCFFELLALVPNAF